MSDDDKTGYPVIELRVRSEAEAVHRRPSEQPRCLVKRVQTAKLSKAHSKKATESKIEDEFFKLANRMGDEEEPEGRKQQSHAAHPASESEGQQRLWRELHWQAEQRNKGGNKRPQKKSGAKSKPSETRKRAA